MLLVLFALMLQVLVILERLVHISVRLFLPTTSSAVKHFSARLVWASVFDIIVVLLSLPIQIFLGFVSVLFANLLLGGVILVSVGGLALLSQNSSELFAYSVNAYNSGIGIGLNKYLVTPFLYLELLLSDAVPLFNSFTWLIGRILLQLLEIMQQSIDVFPDLASNISLLFTSLGRSGASSITKMVTCWSYTAGDPDLNCIGNSLATSLDLMSPGVYMQGALGNVVQMLTNVCSPAVLPLNVLLYPLLDVNLYMAIHSIVNAVWSLFFGTWIQRAQRCSYGAEAGFLAGEQAVMCMPDFNTFLNWIKGTLIAGGQLVDNWLDMQLVFVERAWGSDSVATCKQVPTIGKQWTFAGDNLDTTRPRRVVGLTDTLYAITDGQSTVYRSLVQGGRDIVAEQNWPFVVEPRYGIAAVQHSELLDADYGGFSRTGLLGCRCDDLTDGETRSIQITCASVPFLDIVDDEMEQFNASTTHRIVFPSPLMTHHMRCRDTHVKVSSLRFSRKRASVGHTNGFDAGFRDRFDGLNEFGDKLATFSADAAIYISPRCSLETADSACLPNSVSCYPFCMALHVAGMSGQNISAYNARRWRESVQVRQLDCASESIQSQEKDCVEDAAAAFSDAFGFEYTSTCRVDAAECVGNDVVHTSVPLTDPSVANLVPSGPSIRLQSQPFVMAGDIMLFIDPAASADASQTLVISRLYDNNRGDYSLINEQLVHLDTVDNERIPVVTCQTHSDAQCALEAVQAGSITKPMPDRLDPLRSHAVAVSEWGVHWADNPDNAVLSANIEWCAQGSAATSVTVASSYGRARIWTVRATRLTLANRRNIIPQDTPSADDNALTAYMTIPDWLTNDMECTQEVNLKVVDLEYINAQNILVTVLRAAVRDYDVTTGTVREGRPFTYSFYYIHPNQHRCLSEEDADAPAVHTCWRTQAEGMFESYNVPTAVSANLGILCPALQRMPQLGALAAHVILSQFEALRIVLDIVLTVPVAIWAGTDLYALRIDKVTFHPVLDGSGTMLFDFNEVLYHLDMAAFHLTNSMVRIFAFFDGMPGYSRVQPIVVGTAKVLQFAGDSLLLQGPLLSLFAGLKHTPALQGVESVGGAIDASPMGGPVKENKFIVSVKSSMQAFTTSFRYVLRVFKPLGARIVKLTQKQRNALYAASASGMLVQLVPSLLADTEQDFRRSFTNNMRLQCDGLATIFGTTNPIATSLRHACLLLPNSFDSTLQVLIILTVDYPAVSCACVKTQEQNAPAYIEQECLLRPWGARNRINMQQIRRHTAIDADAQNNLCFAVMDTVNTRLLKAYDPVYSRMAKLTRELGRAVDYVFTVFYRPDAGSCDDYISSPYAVSIVPYPIDYFVGCVHTPDCRVRCKDSIEAFELALSQVTASDGQAPLFSSTQSVRLESRFFSETDVLANRHLLPFVIYAILELSSEHCAIICNSRHPQHRCVAVAGQGVGNLQQPVLATAYYCVSADFDTPVFQYSIDTTRALPSGVVDDMFFASSDGVLHGTLDAVVVLTRSSEGSRLVLATAEGLLVSIISSAGLSSESAGDRIQDFQVLEEALVLPSSSSRQSSIIYALGTHAPTSSYGGAPACVRFELSMNPGSDSLAQDITTSVRACQASTADLFPEDKILFCVTPSCTGMVLVPRGRGSLASVEKVSFDPFTDVFSERSAYQTSYGNSASVGSIVNIDKRKFLFRTQEARVGVARRRPSLWALGRWHEMGSGASKEATFDFFVSLPNTNPSTAVSWLAGVRLALQPGAAFQAQQQTSLARNETLIVNVECSLDNCIGCRPSSSARPDLEDLQAKCFVAQQCSVAQCAGTMVNMRKPLCNLGKVLASPMDLARVALMSSWVAVSYSVIGVVELSQSRRQRYELAWVDEIVASTLCNLKDVTTEAVALFTSVIGSLDYVRESLHRDGIFMRGYQIDPRYHARVVMSVTALTRLIAAIFHFPQFAATAVVQGVKCGVNDTVIVLQNIIDPDATNPRIEIGSRHLTEARSQIAGVCLSQSMRSVLQEIDAEFQGRDGVGYRITDALTQVNELVLRSSFIPIAHSIDAAISYAMGIVDGLRDMVQTIDWYHCKPPVGIVPDVSECVCGDTEFSIPSARKTGTHATYDFWCSGPLIFDSAIDEDVVVWNPYSLHELLQVSGIEQYVQCLSSAKECDAPPRWLAGEHVLMSQGVEVLQVITRCRSNFQRKKWDDGAVLLGTFPAEAWQHGELSLTSGTEDKYQNLRQQLVRKSRSAALRTHMQLRMPMELWGCLHTAALNGQFQHRCLEFHVVPSLELQMLEQYFEYEPAATASFANTDACQTFTGKASATSSVNNASHTSTIWSPNSVNSVPVATYHFAKVDSASDRVQHAEQRLQQLLNNDILPYLEDTASQNLNLNKIEAAAWTLEADHLHQLLDCVMLGPYAAADLHASFDMSDGHAFPVPQYHRGDAASRDFPPGPATGGSYARRMLIGKAVQMLTEQATSATQDEAERIVRAIRNQFKDINNLRCRCRTIDDGSGAPVEAPEPSVQCCTQFSSLSDVKFQTRDILSQSDTSWNLVLPVLQNIFDSILSSDFLQRDIWASSQFKSEDRPLTLQERFELQSAYVFDFNQPVREYSTNEINANMQGNTLWHQCTNLLSAMFFTLPLKPGESEADANTAYDPTSNPESSTETNRYTHAIERAVDKLLARARLDTPHFWTHVHRYVPSDSVWCETKTHLQTPSARSVPVFPADSASWGDMLPLMGSGATTYADKLQQDSVDEVMYPGELHCLCGWVTDVSGTPYCASHPPELLCTDWNPDDAAWQQLCVKGTVDNRDEYFQLLQVMEEGPSETWMQHCVDSAPGMHWGVMDRGDVADWFDGASPQLGFGMLHELATEGPGGLRLGLLGARVDALYDHVRKSHVLRRDGPHNSQANFAWKHTVAQPYCASDIPTLLATLGTDLTQHFPDVFFPMAHSIHDAPASAYCSRYMIEVAMLRILQDVLQQQTDSGSYAEGEEPVRTIVLEQQVHVSRWKLRCVAQLEQVGLCQLRGVYDIRPSDAEYSPPTHCGFSVAQNSGCVFEYVTDNCLVFCKPDAVTAGRFYDPCAHESVDCENGIPSFTYAGFQSSPLEPDVRSFVTEESVRLLSMHWPTHISLGEAKGLTDEQKALQTLLDNLPRGKQGIDLDNLFTTLKPLLEQSFASQHTNEGTEAPSAYCDDLFDYWDGEAQHPVGYHPSTACTCADTRMRGFTSWMSAASDGSSAWRVDPRRLRNFTHLNHAFGAGHLVCDRGVYGREGVPLNPFYLESKWNPERTSDPAVPLKVDSDYLENMTRIGINDKAATFAGTLDTALRNNEHSTGLVRGWPLGLDQAAQSNIADAWPYDLTVPYGLSDDDRQQTSSCKFPSLRTCLLDSDCSTTTASMQCLRASADAYGREFGICSLRDTCFQHRHCPDDKLCSGTGQCVAPIVYFQNDVVPSATVSLYSDNQCSTDTWGSSHYQQVPSFARDHGLCRFRDWFNYQTITEPYKAAPVLDIANVAHRTSDDPSRADTSLKERRYLHMNAHPCDRSHEHTSYKRCVAEVDARRGMDGLARPSMRTVMSTWRRSVVEDDVQVRTPLCYMESHGLETGRQRVSGFLDPYQHIADGLQQDTLAQVPNEVGFCEDFESCLPAPFTLGSFSDANGLERRVLEPSNSATEAGILTFAGNTRQYTERDAQTCFAFAYIYNDGVQDRCIVDRYTSPILDMLFGDTTSHASVLISRFDGIQSQRRFWLQERWALLQSHCATAFQGSFSDFEEFYYLTTSMFLPEDRAQVLSRVNQVFFDVFGTAERGFLDVNAYISLSRCAQHIHDSLTRVQQIASRDVELPYASLDFSSPPTPGMSLYLFHERAAVEISLEWLWKCHFMTRGPLQGGAPLDWFSRVTIRGSGADSSLSCPIYDSVPRTDNTISLRQKLQQDTHLFDLVDPETNRVLQNILQEIRAAISFALDTVKVSAWPNLFCVVERSFPPTMTRCAPIP